jgi:hypothetical protein
VMFLGLVIGMFRKWCSVSYYRQAGQGFVFLDQCNHGHVTVCIKSAICSRLFFV